ncbi:class GN sortase [Nitrospira sp.]|nr:class GN sortase [Nitrospira sp.]
MTSIRPPSRLLSGLTVCLLAVGLWQVGAGSWIPAKARLAQVLLQRAWTRTLAGEHQVRPWPWADTWPVARLTVPSKGIDVIVLNGAYGRTLAFGPGYAESSAFPGTSGTTLVTGHRDTHFRFLARLNQGDTIHLQTPSGRIEQFRVTRLSILNSARARLRQTPDRPSLALITCYPFDAVAPGGPLRYLVEAEYDGNWPVRQTS